MKSDLRLRLAELLGGAFAHVSFEAALAGMPEKLRAVRPPGVPHNAWQLLEHVRICQRVILDFSRPPGRRFPEREEEWWPESATPADPGDWERSAAAFRSDLADFVALVLDPASDLQALIPGGGGRSLLRQALVVADHTAYHAGQLVLLRQLLGAWPPAGKAAAFDLPETADGGEAPVDEADLRARVLEFLRGGAAHLSFEDGVAGFPAERAGERPPGVEHSAWELVEHLRIAQRDILDWSRDPGHVSPSWPEGHWPPQGTAPDAEGWRQGVATFLADRAELVEWIADPAADLWTPFPWGSGSNLLGQALLAADHNAYHLGQVIWVRRLLGAWDGDPS